MGSPPLRVLLVDDDDSVRLVTERMLELEGFAVVCSAGAEVAERLLAADPAGTDVLVADVNLALSREGFALVQAARRLAPGIGVVVMSGYEEAEYDGIPGELGAGYIRKPFTRPGLAAAVRRAWAGSPRAATR